jgi:2-dehydro-3-deoxygluconokinase
MAAKKFASVRAIRVKVFALKSVRVFGVVLGSPHPACGHLLPIRCGEGFFSIEHFARIIVFEFVHVFSLESGNFMAIQLRDKSTCKYDQISLGEVMLRLDPGEGRIRTARHFTAWEGGGEYNTSRGLRKCFGYKTAVCTAFVDNEVGHLIEDFIMQGGVDTDFIKWREDDGIGRTVRNGLNFTERGFGIRGAVGVPDRGNSAASQLKPGDFDWDHIFGKIGTRWLHTGGIFAALSETTAALTIEAVKAAKKHGVIVSYDLNYRPSLWKSIGGLKKAQEVNREIAKYVDVMIGNEEDFTASLGFEVKGADHSLSHIETDAFKAMIETAVKTYPNFKVAATTLRRVITATKNDWSAILWHDGKFHESRKYPELEILDRVGGGDSFASGLQFGFLEFNDPQKAVEYGAAHGALASTTPGDTSMATRKEVEKTFGGGSARVQR